MTGHALQRGQASDQASKRAPGRHRSLRSDTSLERHSHARSCGNRVTNEEHRRQPDKRPRRDSSHTHSSGMPPTKAGRNDAWLVSLNGRVGRQKIHRRVTQRGRTGGSGTPWPGKLGSGSRSRFSSLRRALCSWSGQSSARYRGSAVAWARVLSLGASRRSPLGHGGARCTPEARSRYPIPSRGATHPLT